MKSHFVPDVEATGVVQRPLGGALPAVLEHGINIWPHWTAAEVHMVCRGDMDVCLFVCLPPKERRAAVWGEGSEGRAREEQMCRGAAPPSAQSDRTQPCRGKWPLTVSLLVPIQTTLGAELLSRVAQKYPCACFNACVCACACLCVSTSDRKSVV